MKPFDLQAALAGEPIMYRDGTKPLEWHYFEKAYMHCIVTIDGEGDVLTHRIGGQFHEFSESKFDLFMF